MAKFKPGDWVLPNIEKLDELDKKTWAINQFGPNLNIPLQLSNKVGVHSVYTKQKDWLLYCSINNDDVMSKYLVHAKLLRHKLLEEIKDGT